MTSAEDSPTSSAATDEDLAKSALADNLNRKGKNAYYYAHAHKATGPKWDGKIEPRLLSTSSTSNLSSDSPDAAASSSCPAPVLSSSGKAELMAKSNITNYAFLNEKTKVKVYVNLPGVGECADECIALEFTGRSLCLTVKDYVKPPPEKEEDSPHHDSEVVDTAPKGEEMQVEEEKDKRVAEDRCLSFGRLYGEIENATFRKKADKIILTLTKKDVKVWHSVAA